MADLGEQLTEPEAPATGAYKPLEVDSDGEKTFLAKIKKKNKYLLMGLTDDEKQRIADHIIGLYNDAKPAHDKLCQKIDDWDEVSRLIRREVIGSQGDLPNYRLPISVVAHEVIHANIMNVFFTPKDVMRTIPTSADDIQKVNNVSTFGNWSLKNELEIFSKCDQLFHASAKNGESVAMLYWKKEYGVEIKREVIRDAQGNEVYDEDTQEPVYQEIEEPKLIYNAPWMEVINRKDYIQPEDAVMGGVCDWEARILRMTYDAHLRDELQGKIYKGSCKLVKDWASKSLPENTKEDYDGDTQMVPKWSKEYLEWYGRMKINVVEEEKTDEEAVEAYELEDEFIAIVHIKTKTLCAFRKNKFPMKKRPFVVDYFIPDDSGRRSGIGIYEFMDSMQKAYDALFNQFIYSVELSNNPIVFFTPFGNMRDQKMKLQKGFMYPTSDPNSAKLFQFPGPNQQIQLAMELVQQWAQMLFGISDYAAGMESTIDPSAPAKKAQIVVEQGNVRLNMIIKRKNDTLKDIFKRWFLLYRDNMPKNKFMRIAGEGENDDPWKFDPISYEDFALQSIPDFELTGNVLNANKQLEANKAIAIYQLLVVNALFMPTTPQGMQAYISVTKWMIDKLDDAGLSRFIPKIQNEGVLYTPEEENAVMMKGQEIMPLQNEDHRDHIMKHMMFMNDPATPEQIRPIVGKHIQQTIEMVKMQMKQAMAQQQQPMGQVGQQPGGQMGMQPQQPSQPQGGSSGGFGAQGTPSGVLPG